MVVMKPKPLILIVEDEEYLRDLYREALENEGYEVASAANGVEGVEQFDELVPDLILLDLVMPYMDGWKALERVRHVSDCPVIIITGKGETEDIVKGLLQSGADEYLVKPFGVLELLARVSAVLRRSVAANQWS
jgi:DNA-binding response OmpR family regulator